MLELSTLIWLSLLAGLAAFWWHSDLVKQEALRLVEAYCQKLGLQLLDHTMVIRGLAPTRGSTGGLCLRRTYRFEFTSTGEARYQGTVVMSGRRQELIELEAHVIPPVQPGPGN